jgi:DNA-directed RNA polymerase specialized sigma24 family protein
MNLNGKKLFITREDDNLLKTIEVAFNNLKEQLLESVKSMRETTKLSRRETQRLALLEHEEFLAKKVETREREEFFDRIMKHLNPLRNYIKRRLRLAHATGAIETNLYRTDDILDEVLLRGYNTSARMSSRFSIEEWLYLTANKILEELLKEIEFERSNRIRFEDLLREEIRDLEERITADAEEELVMLDELEMDVDYHRSDFAPPVKEEDYLEQLSRKEQILTVIKALAQIPERDRSIFDLYAFDEFDSEALSRIYDLPPDRIEEIIERVREELNRTLNIE